MRSSCFTALPLLWDASLQFFFNLFSFLIWGENKSNQTAQIKSKKTPKQPEDFFQFKHKDLGSGSFTDSSTERAGESVKGVKVEVS